MVPMNAANETGSGRTCTCLSRVRLVLLTLSLLTLNLLLHQKAEAQLAYELQGAKEQQKIRLEEIEIEVVQRKKQITIEEKEIDRTDKELIATVKRPAEAEAYKIQQLAEGHKSVPRHTHTAAQSMLSN